MFLVLPKHFKAEKKEVRAVAHRQHIEDAAD
jgi:hypothetical protein